MGLAYNARIQRVTNKPRNLNNKANEFEESLIEQYQLQLSNGEKIQPHVSSLSGSDISYFPILTNAMCLQCHGTPGDEVQEITLNNLKTYYPADKALGYGPNEIRGLWKVIPNPVQ